MKRMICFLCVILLCGCSGSDDDQGVISGSGNEPMQRSDRQRSGGDVEPATLPDKEKPEVKEPESGNFKGPYYSYGTRNGGRQAWRIPGKGPSFGKSIKVVFENGHTVYVNNTSKNYRESDGFVFKPGIGPNGEGQNNTGTAHGGVYLHAPYGNRSKWVKFY